MAKVTNEQIIEAMEIILAKLKAEDVSEDAEKQVEKKAEPKQKETNKRGRKVKEKEVEPEVEEDAEEEEDEVQSYDSMTSKALYALCCERGISSKCKKRDKASLIAVLEENDKKGNTEDVEDDDWDDEEAEEPKKDPYAGKTAKELYAMCKERGIKVQPKKDAESYAKLLKKADEAEAESEEEDDEWEI